MKSTVSMVSASAVVLALAGCGDGDVETVPRVFDDPFEDGDLVGWTAYNRQLATASVGSDGLVLQPNANTLWYNASQSVQYYQLATGNFAITADVSVTSLAGGVVQPEWRVGAIQIRNPNAPSVDAYHGGFGQIGQGQSTVPIFEIKNTDNSLSRWWTSPNPSGAGQVRLCRAGTTVQAMWRATPDDPWILADRRERPDLPPTLAAGPIAYNGSAQANLRATFDDIRWHLIASITECQTVGEPGEGDSTSDDGGGSSDPLDALDDDFGSNTLARWSVHNPQLVTASVAGGSLVLTPAVNTSWYAASQASQHYKTVAGNFAVTAAVTVTNSSGGPVAPAWRLAGLMMRNPGTSNNAYLGTFGTVGAWINPNMVFEWANTVNNSTTFAARTHATGTGQIRLCRVGSQVRTLYRATATSAWIVVNTQQRADFGPQLAVGPMAYSRNNPANLRARFDWIDYTTIASMAECTTAGA